jgi:hypothetical protein
MMNMHIDVATQLAARLGIIEAVTLPDGYDRARRPRRFRRWTMDDIINYDGRDVWFEANDGTARRARANGKMKTWKRDPNRFEQSFRYGLYESVRMNTKDMLDRLLVPLD